MESAHHPQMESLVSMLKEQPEILFITGAGMSADSGLPTYRGIGGLYETQETPEGIPIEVALSGGMMHRHPETTWKYIAQIEQACRHAHYNEGHRVIAQVESSFPRVWTLTQNVDGFHREAGTKNLVDIHGDLHDLYCLSCPYRTRVDNYLQLTIPPQCPQCHSLVRPDVVLFEEVLSSEKLAVLSQELAQGFDIVFSIGTTSLFPYIADPVLSAKAAGAFTIEINPGQTAISDQVDLKVEAKAAETLQLLFE